VTGTSLSASNGNSMSVLTCGDRKEKEIHHLNLLHHHHHDETSALNASVSSRSGQWKTPR